MTTGFIINLITNKNEAVYREYNLNEIVGLSKTLKIVCKIKESIIIKSFTSSTLINTGKLLYLKDKIENYKIELVVLNYSLTPSQQKI